jgi:hypothetical protein
MCSPRPKFRQKLFRGYKERILVQNSTNDNEWMGSHDIDHSVPTESAQMICANNGVFTAAPELTDAGLELDQVVDVLPTIGGPIHATNDATYSEPAYLAAVGEFLKNR